MIILVSKPDSQWRAAFKGDAVGLLGYGKSPREAIGDLIMTIAGANDADKATEAIDVAVQAK